MRGILASVRAPIVVVLMSVAPVAADAQEPPATPWSFEFRGGLFYHEDSRLKRMFGDEQQRDGGVVDLNVEVLLPQLWRFENGALDFVLAPRPTAGATINLGSGTSHAYAGFTWEARLGQTFFLNLGLGGSVNNEAHMGERQIGCAGSVWTGASVGANITENWRAMISVEHLDNFDLCDENAGLTNFGFRLGFNY